MTCELVKFNFPITESKWVTAHLPVQFRIESERFPVNTIDDIDSVASVEEGDGGLALFILAGTYEDYEVGEYVKISNATIGGYDGVFRIVEALYPTELLLEVSFLGNATADLQRYYRNYAIKIDVWAGIPNGHQLQTRRPIERKTEKPLLYRPRTDNIAYVDISDFVRADLPNIDNNLCERVINTDDSTAPDTDLWTSFYIAYSEVWDIVDENGNSVQTNTDTQVLGEQLIEDNQFLTESSPFWTNVTSPDLPEMSAPARFWSRQFNPSPLVNTFVAGIQRPSSGTWSGSFSEYYAQTDIPTVAGKEYRLLIDYFKFAAFASGTTDKIFFYDLTAGTSEVDRVLIGVIDSNVDIERNLASFDFTAAATDMTLGFLAQPNSDQTQNLQVVSLELREVTQIVIDPNDPDPSSSVSTDIFYATQSVQQFQYQFGNSMAEYSVPDTGGEFEGKFMTLFEEPVLFEGYEFDLAIILPDDEIYPATQLTWIALGQNRNEIDNGFQAINYQDEGVYRFILSDIAYPSDTFFLQVYVQNDNRQLSETKTVKIDKKACRDGVFLKWLNYLGGWDSWLFTGYQDFGVNINDVQETKRDIFNIWDDKFVNGTTQGDFVRIQSQESRTVRSQYLSESEVNAVRWVRQSIKVQEINKTVDCNEKRKRTVLVDKGSFVFKTNRPRLREIEFNFRYTNNDLIQTQ